MQLGVIIPAAGKSLRFGGPRNKLLSILADQPVIAHAVRAFLSYPSVTTVIVPTQDPRAIAEALGTTDSRIRFCPGGATRADSVRHGLCGIDRSVEWVAVHDGARPLVSPELIERTFAAAQQYGAAVPAMPVNLTIKQAAGPLPAPVQRTIPRNTLWAVQTPQIMRREALEHAFAKCPLPLETVTDDAQLLEMAGHPVWLIEGEAENLKITTSMDLQLARTLLAHRT